METGGPREDSRCKKILFLFLLLLRFFLIRDGIPLWDNVLAQHSPAMNVHLVGSRFKLTSMQDEHLFWG